ncbi:hypothetical protein [Rhizosaccharibacter radicis]|uniref:PilZ domain-containing protein n=1 Tax=Rhizosaccharibacter radicis TaxID=2782605 RepID=A0ABT1W1B0_9PROT|nr:hypothetical protein [Acetobacteraceae bacterium KSS12]
MTQTTTRHPFIEDLAEEVVLTSSVLRRTVSGREKVLRIVTTGGSLYRSNTPRFLGHVEDRGLLEYDVELDGGVHASGLVSFRRDENGKVTHLHIAFSPLDAVLTFSTSLRERLADELGTELFL